MFRKLRRRIRVSRAKLDIMTRRVREVPHGLPTPLIVSLTSYPSRYGSLKLTLKSLMRQSVTPDAVILWLDEGADALLPADILRLREVGLIIRTGGTFRSYNKIIPALLAYPGAAIVTADDDIYYPRDWLKQLVGARHRSGSEVICHRAHRVTAGADLTPAGYKSWEWNISSTEQAPAVFPTGVLGVLYGPEAFHPDVTREDAFIRLSPTSDDVWLYWMFRRRGHEALKIRSDVDVLEWPGSQETNLRRNNIHYSGNDTAIAAMTFEYGSPLIYPPLPDPR